MVYSIKRKDDGSFVAYMKGVLFSNDGISWYLPSPAEFKEISDLEVNGTLVFEKTDEIEDDSPRFSDLCGVPLLSLQDALLSAGLAFETTGSNLAISCKDNHKLEVLSYEDLMLIVFCPECKTGILNFISFLDATGVADDLFQPDCNYDEIWLPMDEETYRKTVEALSTVINVK